MNEKEQARYDKRKLRTIDHLVNVVSKRPVGKTVYTNHRFFNSVFARFGEWFATNGYILACVEYRDEIVTGQFEWQKLGAYKVNGKLLHPIEWEDSEYPKRDRYFSDMFIAPNALHYEWGIPFDPKLISDALKLFSINDLKPIFAFQDEKLELSAHNREVSIRILVMGMRK